MIKIRNTNEYYHGITRIKVRLLGLIHTRDLGRSQYQRELSDSTKQDETTIKLSVGYSDKRKPRKDGSIYNIEGNWRNRATLSYTSVMIAGVSPMYIATDYVLPVT